jgi:histidinol-phosphate aminotransferase
VTQLPKDVDPIARPRPRPWARDLPPSRSPRPVSDGPGGLESNESILPPSPAAVAAMAAAAGSVHRYPAADSAALRAVIARECELDPASVVVGNGSEELLRLLVATFAGGGGRVVMAGPACQVHQRACLLVGADVVQRPLVEHSWAHDLPALAGCTADLAMICNPHNPTGTAVRRQDLAEFLDHGRASLVVVDEAYLDFADDAAGLSCVPLIGRRRDLVVTRTFSKAYGLAAARVGYLLAHPAVADVVRQAQASFPVNAMAQAGAIAAAGDRAYHARTCALTRELRARLTAVFTRAGYTVVPSQANFVFVLAPDEDALVERLAAGGVRAAPGRSLGCAGAVRVTVPGQEGLRMVARALGVPGH